LVDAPEALEEEGRDAEAELGAVGLGAEGLAREREAAVRPAEKIVDELARLALEGLADLLGPGLAALDEAVAEGPLAPPVLEHGVELVAADVALLHEIPAQAVLLRRAARLHQIDRAVAQEDRDRGLLVRDADHARLALHLEDLEDLGERDRGDV